MPSSMHQVCCMTAGEADVLGHNLQFFCQSLFAKLLPCFVAAYLHLQHSASDTVFTQPCRGQRIQITWLIIKSLSSNAHIAS